MAMPLFVKPDPLDYWKVFSEKHVTVLPATQRVMLPATPIATRPAMLPAIPIAMQLVMLPATLGVTTHSLVDSSVAIITDMESLEN